MFDDKPVDHLFFESPLNMEGSWGEQELSKKTVSRMDLYLHTDNTGFIEWTNDEFDLCEGIGLTFEIGVKGGRTLVDYDGVFSLPDQAMDLLEKNGVNCDEMRRLLK